MFALLCFLWCVVMFFCFVRWVVDGKTSKVQNWGHWGHQGYQPEKYKGHTFKQKLTTMENLRHETGITPLFYHAKK